MFLVLRTSGFVILLLLTTLTGWAALCPDPNTSSLKWGIVPPPWSIDPFSETQPQGDVDAQFMRANILVVGGRGRGMVCNYQNSAGFYSVWWFVNVKIPARIDYHWIESLAGFECTQSIDACLFHTFEG